MSLESAGNGQPRDTKSRALLIAWLKKPERRAEELSGAFGEYIEADRVIASHPNASADLLEKLSHSTDKATRRRVVGNPNTPAEVYVYLGRQFPREFLANPALDLLLMINPGLMEEVPEALLIRLLKHADCPSSLLAWAAGHAQAKVQLAVLMNVKAPEQALEKLRASKHIFVRESVRLQMKFAGEIDPEVAFEQAVRDRLASLSMKELDEAWSAGDIGLAQWEALPLCFRLAKAIPPSGISARAMGRILTDTSWTVESILEKIPGYDGWFGVVELNDLPPKLLAKLARVPCKETRKSIARNRLTPVSALQDLAMDQDFEVQDAVAGNSSTPGATLDKLANLATLDKRERLLKKIADNPAAPPDLLEELASNPLTSIRASVAANPSTPSEILNLLAADSFREVQQSIARNPSSPLGLLEHFGESKDKDLRACLARNRSASAALLESLNLDHELHHEIACNPSTPISILEALSKAADVRVRKNIAWNPLASSTILEALSKDADVEVRQIIAWNPLTPSSILEALSRDSSREVAYYAIRNRNAPLAVRERYMLELYLREFGHLVVADDGSPLDADALQLIALNSESEQNLEALLQHPKLRPKTVQLVADKLFLKPANAIMWYLNELSKSNSELPLASGAGSLLRYPGKDPNQAVLAKRSLASVMALCSGPYIEPSRLVRVAGSTDWLVRAAVARNFGTPDNILSKLTFDANPLVASMAINTMRKASGFTAYGSGIASVTENRNLFNQDRLSSEIICRVSQNDFGGLYQRYSWFLMDQSWADKVSAGGVAWVVVSAIATKLEKPFFRDYFSRFQTNLGSITADRVIELAVVFEKSVAQLNPPTVSSALTPATMALVSLNYLQHSPIEKLYDIKGKALLRLLCRGDTPVSLLELKAKSNGHQVRRCVAQNTSTPVNVLEALAGDSADRVRESVAQNPSTPPNVLEALAGDSVDRVRENVAVNPSTPAFVLEVLAKDSNKSVSRNASTLIALKHVSGVSLTSLSVRVHPTEFFGDLTVDVAGTKPNKMFFSEKLLAQIAQSCYTPGVVLEVLAKVQNKKVRQSVAMNQGAPADALRVLARDPIRSVRLGVAGNPVSPNEVLEDLASDLDASVREAVAANMSTPLVTLRKLLEDPVFSVRASLLSNAALPVDIQNSLFAWFSERLERSINLEMGSPTGFGAINSTSVFSPMDVLRALDQFGWLALDADINVLVKASRSQDWLLRFGVASHPLATEGIMKLLRHDVDPDVAKMAAIDRSLLTAVLH